MSKPAVPLYSSFGKGSKDLLSKGFPSTHKVEVTTKAENGVNFVVSTEKKIKQDKETQAQYILGTFQPKYKAAKYGLDFTGTIDTDNQLKGELNLDDLFVNGLKGIFKGQAGLNKELETAFEYKHELGTATSSFLWNSNGKSLLSATATAGRNGFAAGIETKYSFKPAGAGVLESVTGAVNYKVGAHDVTAFVKSDAPRAATSGEAAPRAVTVGASLLYNPNSNVSLASTLDYDLQKPGAIKVTVGGSYALDADTSAKAKLSNDGKLALGLAKQLNPSVKATLGTELNTFDVASSVAANKFGFAFEIRA